MHFWDRQILKRARAETPLFPTSSLGQMTWLLFGAACGVPGFLSIPEGKENWEKALGAVAGAVVGLVAAFFLRFTANWCRVPFRSWIEEKVRREEAEAARDKAIGQVAWEQNLRSQALGELQSARTSLAAAELEERRLRATISQEREEAAKKALDPGVRLQELRNLIDRLQGDLHEAEGRMTGDEVLPFVGLVRAIVASLAPHARKKEFHWLEGVLNLPLQVSSDQGRGRPEPEAGPIFDVLGRYLRALRGRLDESMLDLTTTEE